MKTIKMNANRLKDLVVDYKKELALIIGGTAIAVAGVIVLRSLDEANETITNNAV